MRRPLLLALLLFSPAPALADEADLIPGGVLDAPAAAPAPTPSAYTVFLEETLTLSSWRGTALGETSTLGHLARLGLRGTWDLDGGLSVTVDAQATHQGGSDRDPDAGRDVRLDLKEAFLAWRGDGWFLEAGRMSLKTGVASGFNPTDHFRSFALITTTTEDASQWREHRLGAVVVRGQRLWPGGGISLAYAPDLAEAADGDLASDAEVVGLRLHATNPDHRLMLTLSQTVAPGLTPQLVAYLEDDRPHVGGSVSYGIGDSLILYGEADLGYRRRLADEFLGMGEERWIGQAALGALYSFGAHVTAAVEYHYNGAGLDDGDWQAWGDTTVLAGVRGLARDRQEPLARHTLWQRLSWSEAFGDPDLTLTALAVVDVRDFSALLQAEAGYTLSGTTTAALRAAAWVGGDDGQYGTASRDASLTAQVRWAF